MHVACDIGATRVLFEHQNSAKFQALCPGITTDCRTALRIQERHSGHADLSKLKKETSAIAT